MIGTIKDAVKNKRAGEAVLYAGLLGLVVSDIVPTPADAIYFRLMEKNKQKLENNEISPRQYWTTDAMLYYVLNPLWWTLVLVAVVSTKGGLDQKLKIGIGIIGAGAVFGVINKNIKEEEKRKKQLGK